jgi:PKD repeat protein
MKHSLQNRSPLPLSWRGFGSILLWVVLVCVVMLPNNTFAQNCPPGSVYPNPQITNPFKPDSSCVADTGKPRDSSQPKVDTCLYACELQYATYCTSPTGNTYSWTVTGGTISGSSTGDCVTVLWGAKDTPASIEVTENNSGCSATDHRCVKIIESPVAVITIHPLQVCKNTWLNFLSNSSGAISYLWDFGDPGSGGKNSSLLQNPEHRYASAGSYVVTLVVGNACGCTDSATVTMTVIDQPGPRIECATTVCDGTKKCYWTPDSCAGATYTWSVTGGTILPPYNTSSICVQWGSGNPQGTVSLAITGCGSICSDTTTIDIPIVPSTTTITGASEVCTGDDDVYSLPAWPGVCCYDWKISPNSNYFIIAGDSTNHIQVHWPPPPGTYIVSVSWHHSTDTCGGSATMTVNVNPPFTMSGPTGPVCLGPGSSYYAISAATWTVTGGTFTGQGTSFIYVTWTSPGLQTVTAVTATPTSYCNSSASMTMEVVEVPQPAPIVGPTQVCGGTTSTYSTTDPTDPNLTLLWSITGEPATGEFISSKSANPVTVLWHSPATISVVQKRLTEPFCSSLPKSLTVNFLTTPTISGLPNVCIDQEAVYSAISSNPDLSYSWSITPPTRGSIVNGQGTKDVLIRWHGDGSGNGGSAAVTLSVCGYTSAPYVVTVNKCTPSITMSGKLCDGDNASFVTLIASPGPVGCSYLWSTGGTSQFITVSSSGNYSVKVTDANGCQGMASISVPLSPGPIASISTPGKTIYCDGDPIDPTLYLSAVEGDGYSYSWSPYGETTPKIHVTQFATYQVTVSFNGCTKTSNPIEVKHIPCIPLDTTTCTSIGTVDFTMNQLSCNKITFTGTKSPGSSIDEFVWDFGDGISTTEGPPLLILTETHTYAKAGYYHVILTGKSSSVSNPCPASQERVDSVPVAADFNWTVDCEGKVDFKDLSTYLPSHIIINGWNWTFSGGTPSTSTSQNPTGVQFSSGNHLVTLTVTDGTDGLCTTELTSKTVAVFAPPSVSITTPTSGCAGSKLDFAATTSSNIINWFWKFDDGATSLAQNTEHTYGTPPPSLYTPTLTVTDINGCTLTLTASSINITSPPLSCVITPSVSPPIICQGATVQLQAPAGASYQWHFNGQDITSGGTSQTYPASQSGNYSVTVTYLDGCWCKTPDVAVTVNPLPKASISVEPGPLICLGPHQTITLTTPPAPGSETYSFVWTKDDGSPLVTLPGTSNSITETITNLPPSGGPIIYNVTVTDVTDPLHPCSNTATITIKVYSCPSAPVITATPPSATICDGDSVKLSITPPPGIINILWSTGVGTTSIVVKTSGTYSVTYTDANGCKSTSSIVVKVYPLPDFSLFPISKDSCCDDLCDTAKICAPAGYSFYQWLEDGLAIQPGGTGEELSPLSSGHYQVILKNEFGCTDTSDPYCVNLGPCDTCLQPPHGLIDWWPGDDTTKDIAGYPNNGTLRNGALYGKGKVLDAFSFDGIDDYVEVPNHTELNFDTGSFSIDAWIYPRSHNGIRPIVEKRIILDTNIKAPGYRFYLEGGVLKFLMTDNSATGVYSSSASIPDTVWTHVAVTVGRTASGGTGTFYVNGIAIPGPFTPLLGNITNGTSLKIGARFTDLLGNAVSSFFGGKIDELEIFKRALSSTEVKSIYAADSLGKCKCTCVCTATAAAIQPLALTICDTVTSSVSVSPMDGSITPPEHGSTATQGIIKMVVCDSENVILTFILPPHLICAGQTIYVKYPPSAAGWSTTNPPTDWNPFNPSSQFTMSLYPNVPVYVYLGATFIMPGSIPAGTTCTATAVVDIQQLGPERIVQLAQPLCATQISGSIEMPISVTIVPCEWCPNNLLINGDFADSLVGGTMPGGRVANWHLAYGSPDVNVSVGCEDSGSIQMWGNQVLGEAIYQQLSSGHTLIHGHMYSTTLCARWLPGYAHPYPLEFKVRASKTVLTGPQDPNGHQVGTAGPVIPLNGNWQIYGIPVWVADDDYSYITISAVNQSSAQSTDSTSIGLVDGVCIREVVPYFSNVDVAKGWNIISVPVGVEDFSKNTLFPTAISAAFGYQGSYVIKDTLENGRGYWLKFRSVQTIPISGYEINTLSVPVTAGWNMIGSLSVPIPASSIISDPPGLVTSRFFGYNDGYTIYDTLWPSKGYWIKSENIGTLILSSNFSAEVIAKSGIRITPTDELPPPAPDGSTALRPTIPKEYGLDQAYPNPFNPTTTIRYQLPVDSRVSLKVYNVLGEMVTVLADGTQPAGYDAVEWNASSVASGIYYYRLEATSVSDPGKTFTQVKKMILMK